MSGEGEPVEGAGQEGRCPSPTSSPGGGGGRDPCRALAAGAALLLVAAAPALAQEVPGQTETVPVPATPNGDRRPLLEIGVAGGGGFVPAYPASDQNKVRGIIAPYLIYRGDLFRADEQGARARAFRTDRIELALSASGGFRADSSSIRARQGMPDLDWLGEIGPTLQITLWRDLSADHPRRILLDLPVRAVFSTDLSSIHTRGFTFSPDIAWEERNLFFPGSRLRLSIGSTFGTDRYASYFYEVKPEFVRPGRPAYDASGGYIGSRLSLSYRVPVTSRISLVVGGRIENFSGAANADSPLFRSEWGFSVAAGFSWALWRSEATVSASAEPFAP